MSTLLKDLYSTVFFDRLSAVLQTCLPTFDRSGFLAAIFTEEWAQKELKARMRQVTGALHRVLPHDFEQAIAAIRQIMQALAAAKMPPTSIEYIFFADYVEQYGLENWETSVEAMAFITRYISCEFAVRPFLLRYGSRMEEQMLQWSLDADAKVRRLATEGIRPRLPWAMALPALQKNPTPIIPILENLKNDPDESVRRSVANNLNDIAKDHPAVVLEMARRWKGISPQTDALIKHGCRTLLKQGNPDILAYYGLDKPYRIAVSDFKLAATWVRVGDRLPFSFVLHNQEPEIAPIVRLEYAIYFRLQNGSFAKKVFKISEKTYAAASRSVIERNHNFRRITTRTFYTGKHRISLIVNGVEREVMDFELIE